jgi:hypothetical protein
MTGELLIPLTEIVRQIPLRRQGRPLHVATLYRWASKGLRGQRLECVRTGGTVCTSLEAVDRFFGRLTEVSYSKPSRGRGRDPGAASTPSSEVERRLRDLGF